MSNIHGLSLSNPSDAKSADNEEFFGGGATSGTAVWRPTNGPQRQGGGGAGQGAGGTPPTSAEPDLRALIQQARDRSGAASSGGEDRNIGLITVYANGFVVGNGEFRDAKDPRNAAFIAALKAGEVPAELEALCRKEWGDQPEGEVRVSLVDKSTQAFVPPKPKFSFAESKGQQLSSSASPNPSGSSAAALSRLPPRPYAATSTTPTTVLQLVTADRRKLRETFNEDTPVSALYQHVNHVAPLPPSTPPTTFELVAGFPPKPLTDGAQTLKQAGICGASVQQRPRPQ